MSASDCQGQGACDSCAASLQRAADRGGGGDESSLGSAGAFVITAAFFGYSMPANLVDTAFVASLERSSEEVVAAIGTSLRPQGKGLATVAEQGFRVICLAKLLCHCGSLDCRLVYGRRACITCEDGNSCGSTRAWRHLRART